jgi:hypothetical protein
MTTLRKRYVLEIIVLFGTIIYLALYLDDIKGTIILLTAYIGYLNYYVYELKAKLEEHNKKTD